jgi:hypothetical protein
VEAAMTEENETDYEEVEEQVLTRWEKLMQWFGIAKTLFTVGKIAWALIFATATAVVVGEVTDTSPIRDAAVAVGLTQERSKDIVGNNAMYDELMNLIEDVEQLEHQLANLPPPIPGPQGLDGAKGKDGTDGLDGKNGLIGPEGPQGVRGDRGEPGMDGDIEIMFDDHVDLLH